MNSALAGQLGTASRPQSIARLHGPCGPSMARAASLHQARAAGARRAPTRATVARAQGQDAPHASQAPPDSAQVSSRAAQPRAPQYAEPEFPTEAALPTPRDDPCSHGFALSVVWMEKVIGVAVDLKYNLVDRSPVTEYFFWPESDSWVRMKDLLESKYWIPPTERIFLLNRFTQLVDYWNQHQGEPVEAAQALFPDMLIQG